MVDNTASYLNIYNDFMYYFFVFQVHTYLKSFDIVVLYYTYTVQSWKNLHGKHPSFLHHIGDHWLSKFHFCAF